MSSLSLPSRCGLRIRPGQRLEGWAQPVCDGLEPHPLAPLGADP